MQILMITLGGFVLALMFVLGVKWLIDNISFKQQPEKYRYEGDKVVDLTEKKENE